MSTSCCPNGLPQTVYAAWTVPTGFYVPNIPNPMVMHWNGDLLTPEWLSDCTPDAGSSSWYIFRLLCSLLGSGWELSFASGRANRADAAECFPPVIVFNGAGSGLGPTVFFPGPGCEGPFVNQGFFSQVVITA